MLHTLMNTLALTATLLLNSQAAFSVEHPPGHGGGGSSGPGCPKVGVRSMKPAALAEVAAGSTVSAIVFGANYPTDIELTVKKIPVEAQVTAKDDFYVVTANLPKELHNTAARVNIKIKGKSASCTEESGWLVKIIN